MTALMKQDSNATELRIAEEESAGVLPGTPVWYPLEPNSYKDFGGQLKLEARNPINAGRQRKKGTPVDLDAKGGFNTDLTPSGMQELMQGMLFADMRRKNELAVAVVDGTTNEYQPASGGAGYRAGDLLFAKGSTDSRNNGLKLVTGSPAATSVPVTDTGLVDTLADTITISRVGFQFAAGDLTVDADGGTNGLPALKSTTKDFTQLGIIPGEWVCIGDDGAAFKFATDGCNGLARVKTVTAHTLTLDKAPEGLVDEAGTGKTVRLIFGRVLRNESTADLIKRRTYQLERTLGKADSTDLVPQSQYLTKCAFDKMDMKLEQGKKIEADFSLIAGDEELRTGADGLKAGLRPVLVDEDAFNSTSHVARFSVAKIDPADASPIDLYAYMTSLTLTVDNKIKANKAIKVLGAFDTSAGQFTVSAKAEAYFANITPLVAARQNADVTMDITLRLAGKGWTIDVPLLGVGDVQADAKQDDPIMLPLSIDAGTAARYGLDYTLLIVFWDYLPGTAK